MSQLDGIATSRFERQNDSGLSAWRSPRKVHHFMLNPIAELGGLGQRAKSAIQIRGRRPFQLWFAPVSFAAGLLAAAPAAQADSQPLSCSMTGSRWTSALLRWPRT